MGKQLKYKVPTKVKRVPIPLNELYDQISMAYGNSENKDEFIVKLSVFVSCYKTFLSDGKSNNKI